ncbi:hypothetical protein [Companilactobacillus sp.]|jgi:hypothetical protein|uniref:hypothetical protein n=1 Tax=Companilactobacillus sp. TaxID=2767905 RepID=UPI0025BD4AB6|nr:hypothetical protein [Companilactobacillus sp.]MCH4009517.1 hypothetical protein [Companilactobacillus sp.]MCH4052807.1 hypothetical protein [Companilactobacillus sp.]MCH4077459.1 hypothetical protein [Companilactobacillus sp.]MCH4126035.1 hypothetical protein [Companilactobacillus sp.]MCI1311743.1 hypothetical protein [Companilactobacillus sp.]
MVKIVELRKLGNDLVLTAPSDMNDKVGEKYLVNTDVNGVITYEPSHHKNIFSDPEWRDYDYQKAMREDPELRNLF